MTQPTKCPICYRDLNRIGSSLVCQLCHLMIALDEPYQHDGNASQVVP